MKTSPTLIAGTLLLVLCTVAFSLIAIEQFKTKTTDSFKTIPSGTIVAWIPTEENGGIKDGVILPPEGWLLCDGLNGSPDLENRFVKGTNVASEILQNAGDENSDGKVKPTGKLDITGTGFGANGQELVPVHWNIVARSNGFVLLLDEISITPPSTSVCFIIKK